MNSNIRQANSSNSDHCYRTAFSKSELVERAVITTHESESRASTCTSSTRAVKRLLIRNRCELLRHSL